MVHYIHELFRITVKYISEVKHQTISKCPHWDNQPPPPSKKTHLKIDLDHGDKNKWWFNQNKIGGQLQCCVHASVGELSELARLGMHSHMTVKQCIIQLNLKDHASHPSQSLIVRNPTGTYPDHMHRKVELSFISFQSLPFFDFAVVFW